MRLRVHHLFCAALFAGKGYSESFAANMQSVADRLFPAEEVWDDEGQTESCGNGEENCKDWIVLCTEPDLVCCKCPNLTDGICSLDDNQVVSKDIKLAKELGLTCGRRYQREELLQSVFIAMEEEIFENSCHKCRWYAEGLCSYSKLKERYEIWLACRRKERSGMED